MPTPGGGRQGYPIPEDDTTFGYSWIDTDGEHGGAVDGGGATGL